MGVLKSKASVDALRAGKPPASICYHNLWGLPWGRIRGNFLSASSSLLPTKIILGIESSCDETAAAVVSGGERILSSVVASQIAIHRKYGGVVPELASREHLRQIVPVVREAVEQAGITLQDVDAVAVTRGPGLVGALLVGITYGKVLAQALGKPLIGVNHLEGHVHAVFLEACGAWSAAAGDAGGVLDRFGRAYRDLFGEIRSAERRATLFLCAYWRDAR